MRTNHCGLREQGAQCPQHAMAYERTPGGAQESRVIYSLIETAKENGLDPYRYLLWLLQTAPKLSRDNTDWAKTFLPGNAPDACKVKI